MNSLCGTTTSENIFKELEKKLSQYNLKWNLLRCIVSDNGEIICRAEKRLRQIHKFCRNVI